MSLWPVFVMSHGRAKTGQTFKMLAQAGIDFEVCVEAQEALEYKGVHERVLVNTAGPRTIVGARQTVLNVCRERGIKWFWQFDDTIMSIYRKLPGLKKSRKCDTREALLSMQEHAQGKVALVSPDFKHLAWAQEEASSRNTRCMVITGTRTDTGCDYDLGLQMKEDLDFCLSHLSTGWETVLDHEHQIDEVAMGKNKTGGLVERYKEKDFHLNGCLDFLRKWPTVARFAGRRRGRPEVQVRWASFRKNGGGKT